ncbi:MAG: hypothetical protein KGJ57_08070 [Sphingomonadales bacterium]|nr:hypothetical protein [Sphingomonadales bacterium]MDE2169369.1 hypothetical protein [Sphingomonadales bacterium]
MSAPPGSVVPARDPATDVANFSFERGVAMKMNAEQAKQRDRWQRYHQAVRERRAAVAAREDVIASIRTIQAHREAAYDRAMEAWHVQVTACRNGERQACLASTPDSATFE